MPSFEWDVRFSVGVRQIDQHNQNLFNLLNLLHKDLHNKSDTLEIKCKFEELLDYVIYHFACEEIWMTHTGYSLIHDQEQEHIHIKQIIINIYQEYQKSDLSILKKFPSLFRLIISHIQKLDTTYGHFANDKLSSKLMTKDQKYGYRCR